MTTVITFLQPIENNDNLLKSPLFIWQQWTLGVAKCLSIYCAFSIAVLFLITWLDLTGFLVEGSVPLKHGVMSGKHIHTIEFMTILVSIRGGLYYMAGALKRAAEQVNSEAICIWLVIAICILFGEFILGVALVEFFPGLVTIIVMFLIVEILIETSFVWVVWNFKKELNATECIQIRDEDAG